MSKQPEDSVIQWSDVQIRDDYFTTDTVPQEEEDSIQINPKKLQLDDDALFVTREGHGSDNKPEMEEGHSDDSNLTQHSTEHESHRIMITAHEFSPILITSMVNLLIDLPKNREQYQKFIQEENWDYGLENHDLYSFSLCLIHPESQQHFISVLESKPLETAMLQQTIRMMLLLRNNTLANSFETELEQFHSLLKLLPESRQLVDSMSSSFASLDQSDLSRCETEDDVSGTKTGDLIDSSSESPSMTPWIWWVGGGLALTITIAFYLKKRN